METKLNEIIIFRNSKKPEGSKQPDYRGELDCDGVKKEVALWVRESQQGTKYFAGRLSEPYQKSQPEAVSDPYASAPEPGDNQEPEMDPLPF